MPDANPFEQVVTMVWALLEGNTDFATAVKPGNRIKYNNEDERDTSKHTIGELDVPEVVVEIVENDCWLGRTSCSSSWDTTFAIFITTGEQNQIDVNELTWIIQQAMVGWTIYRDGEASELKWRNQGFLIDFRMLTAKDMLDKDTIRERQIRGWTCAWAGTADIWLPTSFVIDAA